MPLSSPSAFRGRAAPLGPFHTWPAGSAIATGSHAGRRTCKRHDPTAPREGSCVPACFPRVLASTDRTPGSASAPPVCNVHAYRTSLSSRSGPDPGVLPKSSNDNNLDRFDLRPGAAASLRHSNTTAALPDNPPFRWRCVITRCFGAALLHARRNRRSARSLILKDLCTTFLAHKLCINPAATAVHQCDHTRLCNWHGESG